eukprot:GHVS01010551.1.p2 GENE.GHVS01010551.1~~GHVS01010551.1.p2  ORF type:complete len:160 (+),score=33.73 GHVS01010551.1:150-629(+)
MSSVKTTIKTDICSFSEYRIYPGRGKRFIARDGKIHMFITKKAASLFRQKKKPSRLTWTQGWRRLNKKMRLETTQKKKSRKTAKVQKAIVGLTVDDIKRKRAQRPELRQAARDAALKEARERQQKKQAQKAAVPQKVAAVHQKAGGTVPKQQKIGSKKK